MPAIESVRVSAYEIPTDQPESDGTLSWDSTTLVVVEADAEGKTGIGYTYAHQAAASLISTKLAGVVEGGDPLDVRAAWTQMVDAVRNLGATGIAALAIPHVGF